ncbi:FtsK/SpoIIIE domain-containing protein [Heyndrickxia coagulans]|uniref:FtsK/SpoIIIE domain-containing protein n=1 Tax=Heyndrickxia coagulans TaxID=1398 RepID=UPI0018A6FE8A|nr:FtsK/SpoIIIE domain-containing protein [Heyndrickxia coagulans]MBF8418960.1 cell division protein FtsK [Heyndrickxia coagulans]
MIEWLLPAAIAGAALVPKKKMSPHKKLEQIFKNRDVCVKNGEDLLYPKLIKQHTAQDKSIFVYSLPLGMPADIMDKLESTIETGLNSKIEWEFDGVLKIMVYHHNLPESWSFDAALLRPGTWEVPIGKHPKGIIYHDFDKYPHLLTGGTTRFGKTVFLKQMFNALLLDQLENVEFYILDLKAGLEFYKYKALPNVREVACDVYEAAEVLNEITESLKKREVKFRNSEFTNIVDTNIKKRTFIIVDEGAELAPDMLTDKQAKKFAHFCQAALGEIARIGGGLGYRLIFATQYPTRVAVPMQVKMNIVARVAFTIPEVIGSRVILDEPGAEDLPAIPGRAIYKVEKKRIVQVPYITDKQMFKMMEERMDASGKAGNATHNDRQAEGDDYPPINADT